MKTDRHAVIVAAGELGSCTVGVVDKGYQKLVVTCTSTPFRRSLGVLQAQEFGEESIHSRPAYGLGH